MILTCVSGWRKEVPEAILDACLLEYMSAMDFFEHLKLVLCALNLPVHMDKSSWSAIQCQILQNTSQLVFSLVSTPKGISLLRHHGKTLHGMSERVVMNTEEDGYYIQNAIHRFQRCMTFVQHILRCCQYMERIRTSVVHSPQCGTALEEMTHVGDICHPEHSHLRVTIVGERH